MGAPRAHPEAPAHTSRGPARIRAPPTCQLLPGMRSEPCVMVAADATFRRVRRQYNWAPRPRAVCAPGSASASGPLFSFALGWRNVR